jgi:short-subunit dehydrogenase
MPDNQTVLSVTIRSSKLHRYGKWALVTGASDGIGQAIARELASQGMNLVLVARRESRLREMADALHRQFGVSTQIHALDLQLNSANETLLAATEALDIGMVVAAAGFGTSGSFLQTDASEEAAMVDVNCRSVVQLTHAFAKRFAARAPQPSALVLLSSLVAFQGVPNASNYAASKAFIQSLAEGLAVELAPMGIDVLAVAPGPVTSGFAARANMTMASATPAAVVAKATVSALGRRRFIRPGGLSKLLGYSLSALPRWGRVLIMSRVMAGMTKRN